MQEERNNTNDWQTVKLGDLGRFNKGKGISKNQLVAEGVPCVRYGELYTQHHYQIRKIQSYITKETANECYKLSTGDILFAGSGETREEIGKCATFLGEQETYAGGDIIVFSPCESDPTFLGYLLNSENVRRQKAQMGQGDAVVHIYANSLKELDLKIPKRIEEQTAIATVLSDADALITALEKLIEKKRMIKQGMMQELLRPNENSKIVRLGDVGRIDQDNLPSQTSPDFLFRYISLEDVDRGKLTGFTELTFAEAPSRARRRLQMDDILISTVRPNLQSHLYMDLSGNDWVCSTGFSVLRCDRTVAWPRYVFYNLFGFHINRQIDALITGSNYPAINSKDVGSLMIPLPPLAEQVRIGNILTDMDQELSALKIKLEKQRMIKNGMMQELLTGRTRIT